MTKQERFFNLLHEFVGSYDSKKEFRAEFVSRFPEYDSRFNYLVQYVQLVNKNGVPSEWYDEDLSRDIQVTFITNPDKTCTIVPYFVTR